MEKLHISISGMDGREINADYGALPPEVKRKVDYTAITVIEIKFDQEEKWKTLQTIYANLNRNGAALSRQEQRNGIYMCEFYDMLQEFNRKNVRWRKLWGRADSKDRDLEMLLRFCALRKYVSYSVSERNAGIEFKISKNCSSYGELLDFFSEESLILNKGDIEEYKRSLENFVDLFETNTILSSKSALMEGFYVVFEKLGMNRKITKPLLDAVQNADNYKNNSRDKTVNIKRMNGRWNTVYEIWNRFSQ